MEQTFKENKVKAYMHILKNTSLENIDMHICRECGDMGESHDSNIIKIMKENNIIAHSDDHFVVCDRKMWGCPNYCVDCVDNKFYMGCYTIDLESTYKEALIICDECADMGTFYGVYDDFPITVWDNTWNCDFPKGYENIEFKVK